MYIMLPQNIDHSVSHSVNESIHKSFISTAIARTIPKRDFKIQKRGRLEERRERRACVEDAVFVAGNTG